MDMDVDMDMGFGAGDIGWVIIPNGMGNRNE